MKASSPKPLAYKVGNSASHLLWLIEKNGGSMTPAEMDRLCKISGVRIEVQRTLAYNTAKGYFVCNDDGTYSASPAFLKSKAEQVTPAEPDPNIVPPPTRPPFRPLSKSLMPSAAGRRPDSDFWQNVPSKHK